MIVYRASEVGRCQRASVADRVGKKKIPASDRMLGLYERGNAHEDACLRAMEQDEWTYWDTQREVTIPIADGIILQGHLDGICSNDLLGRQTGARVLEIKAPYTFASFEHAVRTDTWTDPYMEQISWQVSAYMVATGLECVMACVDDTGLRTFGIERPIHTEDEIIERVVEIERWVQIGNGEVPDGIPCPASFVCAWPYLHTEKVVTPIDDPAIIDDVSEYLRWGAQERLAKVAKEKLRDQLLERLQVGTYQTGDAVTTVYEQAGAARWDEESLVARYGPDVRTYKKAGTPSRRMKITDAGE